MQYSEIKKIISRINAGIATNDEIEKINHWYNHHDDSTIEVSTNPADIKQNIWNNIINKPHKKSYIRLYLSIGSAAALLLMGTYFYTKEKQPSVRQDFTSTLSLKNEIGEERIISTTIEDFLDSTKYVDLSKINSSAIRFVETKDGEFVKIILPDGSKVALNTDTKIEIDENFNTGKERIVHLDGEAYFEIAKNSKRPFFVKTKAQVIRVVGTKFNVKAYAEQSKIITALYEGQIVVSDNKVEKIVSPNQMVISDENGLRVEDKDLSISKSWRNVQFSFEEEKIEDVLSQLASWYGFKIKYESKIPNQLITGQLESGAELKDILLVFKDLTGGSFTLESNELHIKF